MKNIIHTTFASLLVLGVLATAPAARAQTVENKIPKLMTEGIINDITPEAFVIQNDAGRTPVEYSPKTTKYVDEQDNPVAVSLVTAGLPVKVFYAQMGDRLVASKVVVKKSSTTTTTQTDAAGGATTTVGVVTQMGPETFLLRTEGAVEPDLYTFSKTTTYVDENGKPVSYDTLKSGAPVTVFYTKVGNKMVASRVMVKAATVETVTDKQTTTITTPPANK